MKHPWHDAPPQPLPPQRKDPWLKREDPWQPAPGGFEEALRGFMDAISALVKSKGGSDEGAAVLVAATNVRAAHAEEVEEAGKIGDRCPGCGVQSLFLGKGGLLTCSVIGCRSISLDMWLDAKFQEGRRTVVTLLMNMTDSEIHEWLESEAGEEKHG